MNLKNFIEGLKILEKYYDDLSTPYIYVDGCTITIDPTDKLISEEDLVRLKELKWLQYSDQYNKYGCWVV